MCENQPILAEAVLGVPVLHRFRYSSIPLICAINFGGYVFFKKAIWKTRK